MKKIVSLLLAAVLCISRSMYIINQDDGIYMLDAGMVYKVNDGE